MLMIDATPESYLTKEKGIKYKVQKYKGIIANYILTKQTIVTIALTMQTVVHLPVSALRYM